METTKNNVALLVHDIMDCDLNCNTELDMVNKLIRWVYSGGLLNEIELEVKRLGDTFNDYYSNDCIIIAEKLKKEIHAQAYTDDDIANIIVMEAHVRYGYCVENFIQLRKHGLLKLLRSFSTKLVGDIQEVLTIGRYTVVKTFKGTHLKYYSIVEDELVNTQSNTLEEALCYCLNETYAAAMYTLVSAK
jgi:hypothetical protein